MLPHKWLEGCCSIHLSYGRAVTQQLNTPPPAVETVTPDETKAASVPTLTDWTARIYCLRRGV